MRVGQIIKRNPSNTLTEWAVASQGQAGGQSTLFCESNSKTGYVHCKVDLTAGNRNPGLRSFCIPEVIERKATSQGRGPGRRSAREGTREWRNETADHFQELGNRQGFGLQSTSSVIPLTENQY